MSIEFDFVSDLHIDYWDKDYFSYSDNESHVKKDFPFIFQRPHFKKGNPKILVVAGDISDDIGVSVRYLKKLRKHYGYILYIDGNHEHYHLYPELFDTSSFKSYNGLYYLPNKEVVIKRTAFVGACGWWDYDGGKNIKKYTNYKKNLSEQDNQKLAYNIFEKAEKEFFEIVEKIEQYGERDDIDEIVIITHTVPKYIFAYQPDTDCNSNFENISDQKWNELGKGKIKRWIFGHNHEKFDAIINGIHFLSNPRGSPKDYNREKYSVERSNF